MKHTLLLLILPVVLGACATAPARPPLKTVAHVDLQRFMGAWHVVGTIPWVVERNNVGTQDIYSPRPDGKIDVTYVFRKKTLDAPEQRWKAVATVVNKQTNAEWAVQFIWPFKAPYLVIDLDPDYQWTVIGHPSRDLVWIMSRQPSLSRKTYSDILERLSAQGYDTKRIVPVPQLP